MVERCVWARDGREETGREEGVKRRGQEEGVGSTGLTVCKGSTKGGDRLLQRVDQGHQNGCEDGSWITAAGGFTNLLPRLEATFGSFINLSLQKETFDHVELKPFNNRANKSKSYKAGKQKYPCTVKLQNKCCSAASWQQ